MRTTELPGVLWRKSSRSGSSGDNCVQVAALPVVILVRDSKNPDGARLAFCRAAFGVLAREIRAGRHDL